MLCLWKYLIKLILFVTAVDLVISCLVTNCPRGGKRGRSDLYASDNSLIDLKLKRQCKLCGPNKGFCSEDLCFSNSCTDEEQCIAKEICCSKSLCKTHKPCKVNFPRQILHELKQSSMLLKKLLQFTLNHSE